MSGHSKWSTIKRQKGITDAKRSAVFTKLANAITVATKTGGSGDPDANVRLRLAVDKAKSLNMPNANIERAIKRGTGEADAGKQFEEILYEGYGPGSVALLIETTTDNRNRTSSSVRQQLGTYGGKLGESGSVQWMFARRGVIVVEKRGDADAQQLALIDAGADDIQDGAGEWVVQLVPEKLMDLKKRLEDAGESIAYAQIDFIPTTPAAQLQADDAGKLAKLIEALEENEDVTSVTTNHAEEEA